MMYQSKKLVGTKVEVMLDAWRWFFSDHFHVVSVSVVAHPENDYRRKFHKEYLRDGNIYDICSAEISYMHSPPLDNEAKKTLAQNLQQMIEFEATKVGVDVPQKKKRKTPEQGLDKRISEAPMEDAAL
jgi:hypothetical protein